MLKKFFSILVAILMCIVTFSFLALSGCKENQDPPSEAPEESGAVDLFDGDWTEISEDRFNEILNEIEDIDRANQINFDLYGAKVTGSWESIYNGMTANVVWDFKCKVVDGDYLMVSNNSNKMGDQEVVQKAYYYSGALYEKVDGMSTKESFYIFGNNNEGLYEGANLIFCRWHTFYPLFEELGNHNEYDNREIYLYEKSNAVKIKLLTHSEESTQEWVYVFDSEHNLQALSCRIEYNDISGESGTWLIKMSDYSGEIEIPETVKTKINNYLDSQA